MIDYFTRKKHSQPLLKKIGNTSFYGYLDYKNTHKIRSNKLIYLMTNQMDLGLSPEKTAEYNKMAAELISQGRLAEASYVNMHLAMIHESRTSINNLLQVADQIIFLKGEPLEGGKKWFEKKMKLAENPSILFFLVSSAIKYLRQWAISTPDLKSVDLVLKLYRIEKKLETLQASIMSGKDKTT